MEALPDPSITARHVPRSARVSIVVWQSTDALFAVLEGLAGQEPRPDLVTIWINDDADGIRAAEVSALAAAGPLRVEVRSESSNLGFAAPHNEMVAAAFAAGAGACLVLNPDCRLRPGALGALTDAAERWPGSLLGPVLELADGPDLVPTGRIDSAGIGWTLTGRHLDLLQGAALSAAPQGETTRSGLTGACLLVTRGAYERLVGSTGELFDEDFFAYREDAELGVRAGLIGVRSVLVPQARALHGRALRGTTRGGSALIDRLGVRNRLLLLFKLGHHRPGFTPAALARDLVVIAAAATVERSSWPGVTQAWALHTTMRAKRRRWTSAV